MATEEQIRKHMEYILNNYGDCFDNILDCRDCPFYQKFSCSGIQTLKDAVQWLMDHPVKTCGTCNFRDKDDGECQFREDPVSMDTPACEGHSDYSIPLT